MTITNNEVYSLFSSLYEIRQQNIKFSAKTSFVLMKDLQALEPFYKIILEQREAVIKKYGEPSNEEGYYKVSPERQADANKELYELGVIVNEIDLNKISINELDKAELTITQIETLSAILED